MAPEQFHGDAFPATDIFGLGAVAIALLTRRDPAEVLDPHRGMRWREAVNVTPATRQLLEAMLAPQPEQRAQDAAVLCEHVKAIVHGRPIASPAPTTPRRPTGGGDPLRELGNALEEMFDPFARLLDDATRRAPTAARALELRRPAPVARPAPAGIHWALAATVALLAALLFGLV
jgi:serine/threonine protein kinase